MPNTTVPAAATGLPTDTTYHSDILLRRPAAIPSKPPVERAGNSKAMRAVRDEARFRNRHDIVTHGSTSPAASRSLRASTEPAGPNRSHMGTVEAVHPTRMDIHTTAGHGDIATTAGRRNRHDIMTTAGTTLADLIAREQFRARLIDALDAIDAPVADREPEIDHDVLDAGEAVDEDGDPLDLGEHDDAEAAHA